LTKSSNFRALTGAAPLKLTDNSIKDGLAEIISAP